ncbi:50S ribosomal protein L18a [Candidatus Bathyarchaeota archaeon]|nr:MAG: 50S ribosomal protein L18a [Candidatus Bathyarchaeota archaeon]RLI06565.1 MAG: 50S ribosomal protein L18a [Candidatus Bathyarchaeota archaeon]
MKTYRITGWINKPNFENRFRKELRSIKPEDAIEELYKIFGSKHRVKRFQIKIEKVEEVPAEELNERT